MIDPKLLALATAVTFGLAPVVLKMAFRRGGNTSVGMMVGLLVAVPITFAPAAVTGLHLEQLTPAAVLGFVLGGLAGNAVGRRWNYESINLLGASRATAIRASSPVITAVLAAVLYGEPITPLRLAAILAIVAGAVLVTWQPGGDRRAWLGIGVLYAFLSAVSYGVRPLFLKFGLQEADLPLEAACIGAVVALAWALVTEDRSALRLGRLDASLGLFAFGGALVAVGLMTLTFGLAGGLVSVVYPITASAPLFTLAFTAILLRGVELLNLRIILGVIAVVFGVTYL
jgi:drug/metabolite transporter (DMT)-like permease